jgi:hypothetical protein
MATAVVVDPVTVVTSLMSSYPKAVTASGKADALSSCRSTIPTLLHTARRSTAIACNQSTVITLFTLVKLSVPTSLVARIR